VSGAETLPRFQSVLLRRWITEVTVGDPSVQVLPGWNVANDADGDGWVSDAEFATRADLSASARFRHEARASPLGRMWSAQSSWCRVNPWAEITGLWLGDHLKQEWTSSGLSGAYNDDLLKLVGPTEYTISNGGQLQEIDNKVNSTDFREIYQTQFAIMLAVIANITKGKVTGNISGLNLYMNVLARPFLKYLNGFLREDYLTAGIGLTGYFGLQKAWDLFAMAKTGHDSIVQCQFKRAWAENFGKDNHLHYQHDQESCLAIFYIVNTPGRTFFNSWGNNYWYGSQNTGTWNWFLTGEYRLPTLVFLLGLHM